MPGALLELVRAEGADGVGKYLSTLEISDISSECILLLDALRSTLLYAPKDVDILGFKKEKIINIC